MAGSDGDDEEHGESFELPGGIDIPELPEAPEGTADVEHGLHTAAGVVDTVGRVATALTQLSGSTEGGAGGGAGGIAGTAAGITEALGAGLGNAANIASGLDPGVSQVLGVVSAGMTAVTAGVQAIDRAVQIVEGLVSEANRHRVTFEFESAATPLAEWMVASWTLDERIGEPYCARVVLAIEDLDADASVLLGVGAKLTLHRGEDHERVIGGLVQRVEIGRTTDRARVVTIEIVPALALLALRKDSRIFQNLDALEILDAALGGALEGYAREAEQRTRRTYKRREYCVQYAETDLAFAQRLMEEEGITYFFEWNADGVEKMVLVDGPHEMPLLLPDEETIPFVEQRGETSDTEHVHELRSATQTRTTSFALTDLDWTQVRPGAVIEANVHGEDPATGLSRERYDHDRAVTYGVYEQKAYLRSDARARLATRREAHAAETRTFSGAGNVIRLSPGRRITIEDHPIAALDGELLVLGVSHRGHAPELRDLFGQERYSADDVSYECRFEAIRADVPYRMPERTPKPRVHGLLSAIVVGADGQEIHSDEHRRVRIQLRWDREGTFDDRSSAFVRVMQGWAGNGFGSLLLPRVGMEVAVAFLDGDPDRPMVAGCLYNAENEPPYKTEAEWTKSGIRTRSSPNAGATHGNELTFDDAAGAEQVFLHAQMDLDEHVEHDHTTHVERNQSNVVDVDQSETVGRDATLHVRRHRYHTVEHSEWVTVHEKRETQIDGSDTRVVKGDLSDECGSDAQYVHRGKRHTEVKELESAVLRGGRRTAVTGDDQSSATGRKLVYADGGIRLGAQNQHEIDLLDGVNVLSPEVVRIVVGSSVVSVASNGHVTISATSQLALGCGASAIVMTSDGTIDIIGPAGVNLACGSNSVSLSTSGVTTSGTSVSSSAIADHTITGAIVRIN